MAEKVSLKEFSERLKSLKSSKGQLKGVKKVDTLVKFSVKGVSEAATLVKVGLKAVGEDASLVKVS